jgi:hypothetical protein
LTLEGNGYFKIMAEAGHKTVAVFKRYNLATTEELSAISWERQGITKDADGRPNKKGYRKNPVTSLYRW